MVWYSKPKAYYAVAKGRVPGIYDNWADTKEQVSKFSYCDFRKFFCWDDCFMYLRSKGMTEGDFEFVCQRTHKEGHNPHKKFYAVAVGRGPGIYTRWINCQNEVLGYKGADWLTFECKLDAKKFMKRRGHKEYYRENAQLQVPNPLENITFKRDKEGRVQVYADGSAPNNGLAGATAGIGVWWDVDHPLNLSAPVEGPKATNIVAEIQAATAACRIAVEFKIDKLRVYTDSDYLIKCMNEWWDNWVMNGFMNANKKPVENKEMLLELKKVIEKVDVKFQFVAAHTGVKGNEEADALAKGGAKKFNEE
ncbi:ribonuclease H1 [Diachasma alloeum]|uniref:ribonuclease H1 n=1 Tax=Diachasma alloeum TaxID=454923 RepID=UPI0007384537|nr:ribonuclease H1 [Diachasma alloeum]